MRPGKGSCQRLGRLAGTLAVLGVLGAAMASAEAGPPALRYQTDQRGDLVFFGTTGGFDCRQLMAKAPDPVLGTVDRNSCGSSTEDSSPDVLWRSDSPSDGKAYAGSDVTPSMARTTAILTLPAGAKATYSRIYWSASLNEGIDASSSLVIDRPGAGGFAPISVTADPKDLVKDSGGSATVFQASADITKIVQTYGPGAYRVTGYATSPVVDLGQDVAWVAWSAAVAYQIDTDPVRNLALFDGLTRVGPDQEVTQAITGFVVPSSGSPEGRLTVVAYEGDDDKTGDSLSWNGTALGNTVNPVDNFFNSSRSRLGQPVTTAGDLPQLSGQPNTMASFDLDVMDIASLLKPGDLSATIGVKVSSDVIYLGVLATAVRSKKPILETTLTYPQGATTRPGDTIEFTSITKNTGDDDANGVTVEHTLPTGLTYVPGSVRIVQGPNPGSKTDQGGDDQAEYDAVNHKLTIRLGTGASVFMGGIITPQDQPSIVKYLVRIDDTAPAGDIPTQSQTKGTPSSNPAAGPSTYPSGNGKDPGRPTVVTVPQCTGNSDCTAAAPVCSLSSMPHRCVDSCLTDADCVGAAGGKTVCAQDTKKCSVCSGGNVGACRAIDGGAICITGENRCGCTTDAECGGRKCDTGSRTCPKPEADLSVRVLISPDPPSVEQPVSYTIDVTNKGPGTAPTGTVVTYTVPSGGAITRITPGDGWRCLLQDRTVICTRITTIPANTTTPQILIQVVPSAPDDSESQPGGDFSIHSVTNVVSDGSIDNNPADNQVQLVTQVGTYRYAGGGFSCSMARESSGAGLWAGLAMLAALGAGLTMRRRRRAAANPSCGE